MEPGVPFALLGGVVLLAVAAWTALAAAALALTGRARTPALLVAAGAAVLVVVEVVTGTRFRDAASDPLALARAAGLLLLAAGLYSGALSRRRAPVPVPSAAAGVVVPLGASPVPAVVGALAGLLAAAATLRSRRDLPAVLVAVGLTTAGASAGAAHWGVDHGAVVLVLRGAGALLVLAGLVALARSSLLAKVVAAILAGVLLMALAAVGVVGTTVVRGFEREQAVLVEDAAAGRENLLRRSRDRLQVLAPVLAGACTADEAQCGRVVDQLTERRSEDFALLVPADGEPRALGGRAPLSPTESLGLAGSELVADVLAGGPNAVRDAVPAFARLVGPEPGLAIVVVQPLDRPTPTSDARAAFVYGVRTGQTYVQDDFEVGGFGLTLLVADDVVASNLAERDRDQVREAVLGAGSLPATVPAEGDRPTVHARPLLGYGDEQVGVLALSRSADAALATQRDALTAVLLTALAATAVVAALAVVVGRRTVDPVRRLTVAAQRVSAGDLSTPTGVRGRDEVGTLAGAFDTMTGSLSRLTGDLRASAARLETVLASMSDGLVATDAAGAVTSVNRAALVMAGLDEAGAAHGRPLRDVLDLRTPTGEPLVLDAGTVRDEPAAVHRPDGGTTPVRAAVAPLDAGDGAPGGLVVVLRDTTQEREVERMKTEFLSNVSHELRTPLTPIRGYADILASRALSPEQVTTFASTILSEALKMNRVVDLLVDVAAIEAGRVTTTPRPVPPRQLLDERLAAWRDRAPGRDLRRRAASGLPPVLVDPSWLGKALDELVDNAVKHTPAGTPITLLAGPSPDGERVRLSVRDAGPGLDEADRDLVFTSFEQKDGSATRRVGGLGLGLSFVRRVAQDAGWTLSVTSAPGKGAEFALDLPAAEPVAATPRASRAAPRRERARGPARSPARRARRPAP